VNFAALVTTSTSDMPDMWMRQHCKVRYVST
jgi:hypothetical protein